MKKYFLALLIIVSVGFSSAQKSTSKIALIVAIGDYPKQGGWGKISSDKDVPLIMNALIAQGFEKKNIYLLQDSVATKKGIIKAINEKLVANIKAGDNVVFHYSGHGQQVRDLSGDELDGYDEAIVPFDAPLRFKKGVYEGENHLLDDELEGLFNDLRTKIGSKGSLTIILDACHSGTATRGSGDISPSRGSKVKMEPEGYNPTLKDTTDKQEKTSFTQNTSSRGNNESSDLSPIIVFSGASANQLNYETKDDEGNFVGSLTFALTRALANAKIGSSYTGIFDKVKVDMAKLAPNQSPQIEGDINMELFAGKVVEKQKYYKIEKWLDDKTLVLSAGNLAGVYDNTLVALYDIDTKDITKAKPKATGRIVNTSLIKSDIILDTPIDEKTALGSWVFVTVQTFDTKKVVVKLDMENNASLKKEVIKALEKYNDIIKVSNEKPDIIVDANNNFTRGKMLQMQTSTEYVFYSKEMSTDEAIEASVITKNILSYVQANFLRDMEMEDNSINVNVELILITQVQTVTEGEGRMKKSKVVEKERGNIEGKKVNGEIVFKNGDKFKLKLTNTGTEVAYFNVVDIQPDNGVNVLIPRKGTPPDEYKVLPGQTIELEHIFTISPPYGKEMFKVIATKEPIDLSNIVTTRGTANTNEKPMEKLFKSTYYGDATRGGRRSGTRKYCTAGISECANNYL